MLRWANTVKPHKIFGKRRGWLMSNSKQSRGAWLHKYYVTAPYAGYSKHKRKQVLAIKAGTDKRFKDR